MTWPRARGGAPGARPHPAILAVVVVAVATLAACTGGSATADRLAAANATAVETVDAVAGSQSEVDAQLTALAGAVRGADETVRRLRAPASVDAALDRLEEARQALQDADPQRTVEALGTLQAATATARDAVGTAAEVAAEADDTWAVDYLAAESRVLTAVAEHASAGAVLVEALTTHRDAAATALDEADQVRARRDDLGGAEEAAAVIEVELRTAIDALVDAQEETAAATQARAASAATLNAASADAAAVAERRPSP